MTKNTGKRFLALYITEKYQGIEALGMLYARNSFAYAQETASYAREAIFYAPQGRIL